MGFGPLSLVECQETRRQARKRNGCRGDTIAKMSEREKYMFIHASVSYAPET